MRLAAALAILSLLAPAAFADGVLDGGALFGHTFEFKPLAFSGSALRDGIPSATGLMPWEVVGSGGKFKIKLPSEVAEGRSADFEETEFGVGLPIKGLYYRYKEATSDAEGRSSTWRVESTEQTVGYRLANFDVGQAQWAVEAGHRVIEPGPVYNPKTTPLIRFTKDASLDNVKIIRTSAHGDRTFRHYMVGASRAKFVEVERKSWFGGFGLDRLFGKRFDYQGSAIYINSEERPKNFYLSSRLTARLFKGLSASLDAGMYTKGYTYAPFRYVDHMVPALSPAVARFTDSNDLFQKLRTKAFGYWGVSMSYGVKF